MSNLGVVYQVEVNVKNFKNNTYIKNKFPIVYANNMYCYGKQGQDKKLSEFFIPSLKNLENFQKQIIEKGEFYGYVFLPKNLNYNFVAEAYNFIGINKINLLDLKNKLNEQIELKEFYERAIRRYEYLIENDKKTLEQHKINLKHSILEIDRLNKKIEEFGKNNN